MRLYANLTSNLALHDLPKIKYGHVKNNYLEKIFQRLLVYDQLPDDDFPAVLDEAIHSLGMAEPSFEILFPGTFQQYVKKERHLSKWHKIRQDYNYYIEAEIKRRNRENPYHADDMKNTQTFDELPNFTRQKRNQPWQFDYLYRDAQFLAGEIYEITKNYQQNKDKDLFRAKVNSILVPDKIIFALNSSDNMYDFLENEINIINIKLSMDAYKLSYTFLNRVIESLYKIQLVSAGQKNMREPIMLSEKLLEKIKKRIEEIERRFMLFMDALSEN